MVAGCLKYSGAQPRFAPSTIYARDLHERASSRWFVERTGNNGCVERYLRDAGLMFVSDPGLI
jgi:hypothetical protein